MEEHRKTIAQVRYEFGNEELKRLGEDLARVVRKLVTLEDDKKAAASGFKAMIDETTAAAKSVSLKITNGCEMREMECAVMLGSPRYGMKQIVRPDTGEIVAEERMTEAELQSAFNFQGEKPQ